MPEGYIVEMSPNHPGSGNFTYGALPQEYNTSEITDVDSAQTYVVPRLYDSQNGFNGAHIKEMDTLLKCMEDNSSILSSYQTQRGRSVAHALYNVASYRDAIMDLKENDDIEGAKAIANIYGIRLSQGQLINKYTPHIGETFDKISQSSDERTRNRGINRLNHYSQAYEHDLDEVYKGHLSKINFDSPELASLVAAEYKAEKEINKGGHNFASIYWESANYGLLDVMESMIRASGVSTEDFLQVGSNAVEIADNNSIPEAFQYLAKELNVDLSDLPQGYAKDLKTIFNRSNS